MDGNKVEWDGFTGKRSYGLENKPMLLAEEILLNQLVCDQIPGVVIEQQAANNTLLCLQRVGW